MKFRKKDRICFQRFGDASNYYLIHNRDALLGTTEVLFGKKTASYTKSLLNNHARDVLETCPSEYTTLAWRASYLDSQLMATLLCLTKLQGGACVQVAREMHMYVYTICLDNWHC